MQPESARAAVSTAQDAEARRAVVRGDGTVAGVALTDMTSGLPVRELVRCRAGPRAGGCPLRVSPGA
ncbi:hypothetical protein NUM3379_08250 [Kineococcus sp. NUM-3379]